MEQNQNQTAFDNRWLEYFYRSPGEYPETFDWPQYKPGYALQVDVGGHIAEVNLETGDRQNLTRIPEIGFQDLFNGWIVPAPRFEGETEGEGDCLMTVTEACLSLEDYDAQTTNSGPDSTPGVIQFWSLPELEPQQQVPLQRTLLRYRRTRKHLYPTLPPLVPLAGQDLLALYPETDGPGNLHICGRTGAVRPVPLALNLSGGEGVSFAIDRQCGLLAQIGAETLQLGENGQLILSLQLWDLELVTLRWSLPVRQFASGDLDSWQDECDSLYRHLVRGAQQLPADTGDLPQRVDALNAARESDEHFSDALLSLLRLQSGIHFCEQEDALWLSWNGGVLRKVSLDGQWLSPLYVSEMATEMPEHQLLAVDTDWEVSVASTHPLVLADERRPESSPLGQFGLYRYYPELADATPGCSTSAALSDVLQYQFEARTCQELPATTQARIDSRT